MSDSTLPPILHSHVSSAPGMPQVALLILAIALFAAGGVMSILRIRQRDNLSLNRFAKRCLLAGIGCSIVVLVWHAARRGNWIPLDDNLGEFTWIAVLLAGFVAYDQRRRPVGGLDWFVMPIVVLLLIAAIAFGSARPHAYAAGAWNWAHIASACVGTAAFAIAAGAGATYLVAQHRLRVKAVPQRESVGSLERLDHLTYSSASIGFALLTLATILGFVTMLSRHDEIPIAKIAMTTVVLLIYAIVLHAPINPSFRGRKMAILSITGFVLMAVVLVAVQLFPKK